MTRNVGFSMPEVARASGLTERQVGYWSKTAVVVPSVLDGRGKGNHRRYDVRDVLTFATLAKLRDQGVSLQAVRVLQRYLRKKHDRELQGVHARLVWAPGNRHYRQDVALVHSDEEIESLLAAPGQFITPVVVDFSTLYRDVRERIEEVRRERKVKAAAKKKRARDQRAEAGTTEQTEAAA